MTPSWIHWQNDLNASASLFANSYAVYGANDSHVAWAKHLQDLSVDSVLSGFSLICLGRPGLVRCWSLDWNLYRWFQCLLQKPCHQNKLSFVLIMDDDWRLSAENPLFDKTGYQLSVLSDSVFGRNDSWGAYLLPNQFRLLLMLSNSPHSPVKEDDTMISVSACNNEKVIISCFLI